MSANAWFEEVNIGLRNEILGCVRVTNSAGIQIPISEDAVFVRKPEEDFKVEVFPCVSIYNLSYNYDPIRYNPNPTKLSTNVANKTAKLQEPSIPFTFQYQIDFWSRYQVDMDCMTRTWLVKHFRQFNLEVTESDGKVTTCNCMCGAKVTKSDLVLNEERLYHSIIRLEIWVDLSSETSYNKPIVIERGIEANERR